METTGTNIMKKLTGEASSGVALGVAMGKGISKGVQKTNEERRELAEAYEKENPAYTIESSNLFKANPEGEINKNPALAAMLKAEMRKSQEQLGKQLQKEGWEATKAEVKAKPEQAKTVSYADFIKNKGGSK